MQKICHFFFSKIVASTKRIYASCKKLNNLEITKSVHMPKEMMMIAINVLIFGVSL